MKLFYEVKRQESLEHYVGKQNVFAPPSYDQKVTKAFRLSSILPFLKFCEYFHVNIRF